MKKFTLPLTLILLPAIAGAQYEPLVNLPAFDGLQSGGFDAYINAVYAMFISIAALLAVVKIIVAGVKYMFSDIVTQKSDAKNDIKGALIGLVVIVAAVVILTVINPNLTRFNLDIQANRAGEADTSVEQRLINNTRSAVGRDSIPLDADPDVRVLFAEQCAASGDRLESNNRLRCIDNELSVGEQNLLRAMSDSELEDLIEQHITPNESEVSKNQIANLLNVDTVHFSINERNLSNGARDRITRICQAIIVKNGGEYKGTGNNNNSSLIIDGGGQTGEQISCVE